MNRKSALPPAYKFLCLLLLMGLFLSRPGGGAIPTVQAQNADEPATTDKFTILPGRYEIPESLLLASKSRLGELREISGGATVFGVGYYEEHSRWAWIDLLVANGSKFDEEELGPSFLFFAAKDADAWNVTLTENNQDYLAVLNSISRETLNPDEVELLAEYYGLNQTRRSADALTGNLLFPWGNTQNPWRFSSYGFHTAGFESLGMEQNAEAIDLLPSVSAQPAKVLAMQGGTVTKKLECTWNTVLIVRHDGYPDPKRFLYLHLQNGTSPVGVGMVFKKGQYLGDLRTPVFNGYLSNGMCTAEGSGAFNCELDLNPSTQNLCSYSTARHLHLGIGADRSITIDGNVVADLNLGGQYISTNQEINEFPLPVTFSDVPTTHPYYNDIEILYANGLTGGCATAPLKFCPDDIMNRAQSAVFMVRGSLGSDYVPAEATHTLLDNWSAGTWAEPWAEAIIDEGLSTGCSAVPLMYCPWEQLPREQVVIFGLRMKYGVNYQPPPTTGTLFADMTDPNYYATKWAEKAYLDGLIPACGTSGGKPLFCPRSLVSRGLGAYMIVRAKTLTMP